MQAPDRIIVLSGGVILALGFLKGAITKQPLTPIVEGGIVLILLLSFLDAFGNDGLSKFADAMAILAMIAVVYQDLGAVVSAFNPVKAQWGNSEKKQ